MTPSPTIQVTRHKMYNDPSGRLAARIESLSAAGDPAPVSRAKTTFPSIMFAVITLGVVAILALGNWLHTQTVVFNDVIVKFFLVLIPLLLVAIGYFVVRLFSFLRASRVAEQEAMAEAEAETMRREARFAAGRIKGDRRLVIHPLNPAKRAAKRRRARSEERRVGKECQ